MQRLGRKNPLEHHLGIGLEHANICGLHLGNTAQPALDRSPFEIDTNKVPFRVFLGVANQKLAIAKANLDLKGSIAAKNVRPGNRSLCGTPPDKGGK